MENIDKSWKGFYKISGIAFITVGILFIPGFGFEMYLTNPREFITAEHLNLLAQHQTLYKLSHILYVIMDIASILGMAGIYLSLHIIKRNPALIGAGLYIIGAILDIALQGLFLSDADLALKYTTAASETMKAGYIAAAEYSKSSVDYGSFISIVSMNSGLIITAAAMRAGLYSKKIIYLVTIAGILNILGISSILFPVIPMMLLLPGFLISIFNMIIIGLRLIAIDREIA